MEKEKMSGLCFVEQCKIPAFTVASRPTLPLRYIQRVWHWSCRGRASRTLLSSTASVVRFLAAGWLMYLRRWHKRATTLSLVQMPIVHIDTALPVLQGIQREFIKL